MQSVYFEIDHHSVDNCVLNWQDLSSGQQYPSFKQMEPGIYITSCVDNKLESTLRQLPAEDTGRTIDNA